MKFRVIAVFGFLCLPVVYGPLMAQPFDPGSDPGLRLWLKADDLVGAGLAAGDPVNLWTDASQYGTTFEPRTVTPGSPDDCSPGQTGPVNTDCAFFGHPVEEAPHLQFVNIPGGAQNVPTVRFDVLYGDDNVWSDGEESSHPTETVVNGVLTGTDRLFQTNNLVTDETPDAFDPVNLVDGEDVTIIGVYNPDFTTQLTSDGVSPMNVQVIFGKRGAGSSTWEFGIETRHGDDDSFGAFGELLTVTYAGSTVWSSDHQIPQQTWQAAAMTIEETDPDDEFVGDYTNWYLMQEGETEFDFIGGPEEQIGRRSVPEPMGIGAHSQTCCGTLERFSGNIAEIIVLDRLIEEGDREWDDIQEYLAGKYFTPGASLPEDFNMNDTVDFADFVMFSNAFGQTVPPADGAFDLSGNGVVDFADFVQFSNAFGNTAAAAVPEPTGLSLLGLGVCFLVLRRRAS